MKIFKLFTIIIIALILTILGYYAGEFVIKKTIYKLNKPKETKIVKKIKKKTTKNKTIKTTPDTDLNKYKKMMLIVIASSVGIRENHSFNSAIISTIFKDEIVKRIDYFHGWYRILTTSGDIGWCYKKYLKLKKVIVTPDMFKNIYKESLTSQKYIDKIKTFQSVMNGLPLLIVKLNKTSARVSYSNYYNEVDRVYYGDILGLYAYNNNWIKVLLPNKQSTGWIRKNSVYFIKDIDVINNKLSLRSLSNFNNALNTIKSYIGIKKVKLRSGPSSSFGSIKTFPSTTIFSCFQERNDGWILVGAKDSYIGWIKSSEVKSFNIGD